MSTEVAAEEVKVEEVKTDLPAGETAPEKTDEQKKAEARAYTQEEVDKILAKVRKNERYRTRKEVEAFYQGRESVKPADTKKEEKAEDKEPTRDQFDSYDDYIAARTDFRARKATRDENAKIEQEKKQGTEQESKKKASSEFQTKTREKFPDIDDLIEEVGDMPMYTGVQDAIIESPLGPEIFNELLRNPKEFDRLMALSQPAAIKEIGKLEARLEAKAPKAEEKKETKSASKAPAPVSPPGGSSSTSSDGPSDTDSTEEWMRKEAARLRKLRK